MMVNKSTEGEVSTIRLKHGALDLKLAHRTLPGPYEARTSHGDAGELRLEFADLYEIDMLIRLLTQFKKGCTSYMGEYAVLGVEMNLRKGERDDWK